jgi:ABC-type sugar transport system permease subunit
MNIFLILIALIIVIPISIIGFLWEIIRNPNYKYINAYFKKIAISLDQLGNAINGQLLTDTFTKKSQGDAFGNEDLTVSGILGENKRDKKLSLLGWLVADELDNIEKNHVEDAIGH